MLQPPRKVGPYVIEEILGAGGMGVVFAVRDPHVDRRLALKLVRDADAGDVARRRFWREAELLARVRHEHVVRVHQVGEAREGPFLLMELVEGEELSSAGREWPPERSARVVADLAGALQAIHAAQILHRDLKPHNVMIRPDGRPVLLDFGIARDVEAEALTQTGMPMGTPNYMSPEQANGTRGSELDARCDVYGLGAILFELLGGEKPFAGEHLGGMQVLAAVIQQEPAWPSARRPVPAELEAVVRVAMAKEREERYADASALREDLERFLRGERTEAAERLGVERRRAAASGALKAGGLLLGALVVGLVSLGLWRATAAPTDDGRPSPAPTLAPSAPSAPLWALSVGERFAFEARFVESAQVMQTDLRLSLWAEVKSRQGGTLSVACRVERVLASFHFKSQVGGETTYDTRAPDPNHPLAGFGAGVGGTFAFTLDPQSGSLTRLEGLDEVGARMADAGGSSNNPFFAAYRSLVSKAVRNDYLLQCINALFHVRPPGARLPWRQLEEGSQEFHAEVRELGAPLVAPVGITWEERAADRWTFKGEVRYAEGRLREGWAEQVLVAEPGGAGGERAASLRWEYRDLPAPPSDGAPIRHALERREGVRFHTRLEDSLGGGLSLATLDAALGPDLLLASSARTYALGGKRGNLLWRLAGSFRRHGAPAQLGGGEVVVTRGPVPEVVWVSAAEGGIRRRRRLRGGGTTHPGDAIPWGLGGAGVLVAQPGRASALFAFDAGGEQETRLPLGSLAPRRARGSHSLVLAGEVAVWESAGEFLAISPDLSLAWRASPPGARAPPKSAEAVAGLGCVLLVWAYEERLELACVESASGAVRWRRALPERYRRAVWGQLLGDETPELLLATLATERGHYRGHLIDATTGRDLRVLGGEGPSRLLAALRTARGGRLLAVANTLAPFRVDVLDPSDPKEPRRLWGHALDWGRTTPKTRMYLRAIDLDGDPSSGDELVLWTTRGEVLALDLPAEVQAFGR